MDLSIVRAKENSELTADERTFLTDNKAQLTADEEKKFGLAATAPVDAAATAETQEAMKIQASIKAGTHKLVAVAEQTALESSVKTLEGKVSAFEDKDIKASVEKHIGRGAIKADQLDKWVAAIKADASNKDLLEALPDNKILAAEMGDNGGAAATEAEQENQIHEKTVAIKAAAIEAGKQMSYNEARAQAVKELNIKETK